MVTKSAKNKVKFRSKHVKNGVKLSTQFEPPKSAKKSSKRDPKEAQGLPKGDSRGLKSDPRDLQGTP